MSTKDMPDVIYHYTSNEALLKILGSKSLRLSARHHLNDSMEGEQFFSVIKTRDSKSDEGRVAAIRHALNLFEVFVACFSASGDLLSQWRGYAGNGSGVAIGFKKAAISKAIKGHSESLLYNVAYADDFIDLPSPRAKTINALLSSSGTPRPKAIQSFAKERWSIKPKGFAEEKESRLIITFDSQTGVLRPNTPGLTVGHFSTDTEVREFCDFRFTEFDFIESVTLGPNNKTHPDVLRRFLNKSGFDGVKSNHSAISYR